FGLLVGLFCAKAAVSTARSKRERVCIRRHAAWLIFFCFAMSIGLAMTLSQAGKLYPASPVLVVLGVCAWVTALVLTITWTSRRMQFRLARVRMETGTQEPANSTTLSGPCLKLTGPRHYESTWRFLGLPLCAFATGGTDSAPYRSRRVCGWIAVGDYALSPLLAVGSVAIAPIAIGGVTVGILSLSLWGVALGVFAVGSAAGGRG